MQTLKEKRNAERNKMKDGLFDFLRFMAETGITGIGTFYLAIAAIWGLPFGDEVSKTLVAVSTLLGIFVGYQRQKFNKTTQFGTTTRPEGKENE